MLELNQNHIYTDVTFKENDELGAIKQIAGMVSAEFELPLQEILSGLFAREAEGSTAISQHVIAPHANGTALTKPELMVISFKNPVVWDVTSVESIQLALVLVMPRNDEQEAYKPIIKNLREALSDPVREQSLLACCHSASALAAQLDQLLPAGVA